jgi:hypothetical protein
MAAISGVPSGGIRVAFTADDAVFGAAIPGERKWSAGMTALFVGTTCSALWALIIGGVSLVL